MPLNSNPTDSGIRTMFLIGSSTNSNYPNTVRSSKKLVLMGK